MDLRKCGIRFDSPAIVITYIKKDSGKLHRRTMPLRNFNKHSNIKKTTEELKNNPRHKQYLEKISIIQLEKLIGIIQDKLKGISLKKSLETHKQLETVDPSEDLNKVDDETLRIKKAVMDTTFEKNRKKADDPDFQYDLEVDFEKDNAMETIEWDDESDPDF
ncbi:unnamed protein product [Owenia fusiformis]|uniref:Centrosomal protein of 19 kDa n=1 Tax=Owenia fusiformis TaxID=6347 RepID=A0A8J1UZY5_OWEFU|nr:unnamed protein product [Owenia fusiformis]